MLRSSRRPSSGMVAPLRSRRFKPLLVLVLLFVLTLLYLSSSGRQTRNSEFYMRTQTALQQQREQQQQPPVDSTPDAVSSDTSIGARLKEAEEQAKKSADKKGDEHRARLGMEELPPSDKEAEKEKSVAGRKTMKDEPPKKGLVLDDDDDDDHEPVAVEKSSEDEAPAKGKEQTAETEEEHKVEEELNSILKRSPIIIFSKTYCPYSKKAKRILLEQYKITPAPYVVELDEHALGSELQAALATNTGRSTVPNILINGKSIGGGDDIADLHQQGSLIRTVKSMGGKRIMEASLVEPKPASSDDGKRRRR